MAIAFARSMPLQRSRGHSSIQRLAYITRRHLVSARTGQAFDHEGRPDLVETVTLVPEGCAEMEGVDLWEAVEAAARRPDAALGFELVLALPMPGELPSELSCRMAEAFVRETIVERHKLAATLAVHHPHGDHGEDEAILDAPGPDDDVFARSIATASANLHAHLMIAPRQLTPDGLARKRYTELDPVTRGGKTYGRHWGRLWGQFQNAFFAAEGVELRVTPNPPVPLDPAPLSAVRRWRRRFRRETPEINGRALLVNQTREDENAAIALSIDGAVAAFEAPFTRDELNALFARHLGNELGAEMTQACIGLGKCVALEIAGSKTEWFVGPGMVQAELAVFGRALILAARGTCRRKVEAHIGEGFSEETRTLLSALFEDADLTIIEATGAAALLATDIAQTAEQVGLTPVVLAHAAGHPPPKAVVMEIKALRARMVSQATIIIDDADALGARELSLVFAAAIAGNSKIVLIRRADSDWTGLPLLDLAARHVRVLTWRDAAARAAPEAERTKRPAPPRSAILHAPSGARFVPAGSDWPAFAVDPDGALITTPSGIAAAIRFFATYPYDLEWSFPERDAAADEAGLVSQLARLAGTEGELFWDERANLQAIDADLAAEATAFAMLDDEGFDDVPEDDPDPEPPSPDDFDFEGADEPDWDEGDLEDPYDPE